MLENLEIEKKKRKTHLVLKIDLFNLVQLWRVLSCVNDTRAVHPENNKHFLFNTRKTQTIDVDHQGQALRHVCFLYTVYPDMDQKLKGKKGKNEHWQQSAGQRVVINRLQWMDLPDLHHVHQETRYLNIQRQTET